MKTLFFFAASLAVLFYLAARDNLDRRRILKAGGYLEDAE